MYTLRKHANYIEWNNTHSRVKTWPDTAMLETRQLCEQVDMCVPVRHMYCIIQSFGDTVDPDFRC